MKDVSVFVLEFLQNPKFQQVYVVIILDHIMLVSSGSGLAKSSVTTPRVFKLK